MAAAPQVYPQQYPPITYPNAFQDLNSSNPRTIGSQALQGVVNTGNQLFNQQGEAYDQGLQQSGQTQDYLSGIENPLAQGQGGYTPQQASQIYLNPQQQQDIVANAGNAAGAATAAGADAATRAANAAGGSPEAVAAYRARAAQTAGANAGNAATGARVAAQQAGSQGAQTVGNAQQQQQGQALNYFGNLQAQQNQNAQQALQQQGQTYATQTGGVNNASSNALKASQTPTTFDKVVGAASGALSFLDEGGIAEGEGVEADYGLTPEYVGKKRFDYLDDGASSGRQAVVAEGGPEAVVKIPHDGPGQHVATAIPVQTPSKFFDDGDMSALDAVSAGGYAPPADAVTQTTQPYTANQNPTFWQRLQNQTRQGIDRRQQQPMQQPSMGGVNPSNVGETIGKSVGNLASMFMDDGAPMKGPFSRMMDEGGMGGIFTKPTKVSLADNEAVVPLKYKPNAKTRPSMAMPLVNQIQKKSQPHQAWT